MKTNRFASRVFAFFVTVALSVSVFVKPAHAGLKEWLWDKVIPDIDLASTVNGAGIALGTRFPIQVGWQKSEDAFSSCSICKMLEEGIDPRNYGFTQEMIDEALDKCDEYGGVDSEECEFNDVALASLGGGSLSSVALLLHQYPQNEPVPANLAYYFKDYAQKLPVVKNTAFAQWGNAPGDYPALGIEVVYDFWQAIRNIAYGIMSIVLVVIGIMIITRKKISPQVSVTVQNALPRVIISLILITFSYPIGATLASLTLPLISIAHTLMFNQIAADADLPAMITTLLIGILGGGIFAVMLILFLMIATIVMWLVALFRVMLAYIRILIAIIFAPLQFAIGAVPGHEDSTIMWFKKVIADVLSIPAMFIMILLAWYILFSVMSSSGITAWTDAPNPADTITGFLGGGVAGAISRNLTLLFVPAMMIFCLAASMKMPGLMKEWIVGEKKKK